MADDNQGQKTEQPTGKRLSEAHEEGSFARAPEIQMVFTLAAALGVMIFTGRSILDHLAEFCIGIFTNFPRITVRTDTTPAIFTQLALTLGPMVLPVLLASGGAALLAGGLQSGFQLTPKVLSLKWERLKPSTERIWSKDTMVRFTID